MERSLNLAVIIRFYFWIPTFLLVPTSYPSVSTLAFDFLTRSRRQTLSFHSLNRLSNQKTLKTSTFNTRQIKRVYTYTYSKISILLNHFILLLFYQGTLIAKVIIWCRKNIEKIGSEIFLLSRNYCPGPRLNR